MNDQSDREIVIVRRFDAPIDLVYRSWLEPEHVQEWFAPDGYTTTHCELDARPGGRWRVEYRSRRGAAYVEQGTFLEVAAPERLVLTLRQEGEGRVGPETVVTVTFARVGDATEMRFHQRGFASPAVRDANAEGWGECFRKLASHLADPEERELRALFEAWFRAAAARDLDASMAPIAADVVSYEHDTPLQHVGREAVREVCRRGFEAMEGELRWDIPDLRVLVRGDLAVTWGLNRMQVPGFEGWSRGTRVFQKIDGAWRLIHQHVSYPCDPRTMAARADLRP